MEEKIIQNFDYMTPTRLIFGKGVISELPEVMSKYGKKVLLTYGGGSIKKIGLYDKVRELLADWEIYELSGIQPNPKYDPSGKRGRPTKGIEKMLRMYLLQSWFNLSNEGIEDVIYDSYAFRKFMVIDFNEEQVPDATTMFCLSALIC